MAAAEDEQVRNRERIYIVDHLFTLNQFDFIENCEALSNFVLPDTVLRYLNRKNIQSFHGMKNLIEQEQRQIYYFYNENFKETHVKDTQYAGKGLDYKLKRKMAVAYDWYFQHLQGLTKGNKVYLLTDSLKAK